ncbi:MAG: Bifunctional IPC transferase and DIPP synthase [bacterium ADurb.Bin270]|nr:CDP-alcohol phosphatidyltransferase family protein [Myxococcales bacterium]OQA59174.1 MAG: Bifunctional IPC transferase and DIPP synthase [bacterium ADurb.Bin270]
MKTEALIYVPSDTPEAMAMATRKVAGVPLIIRGVMTLKQSGIKSLSLLIASSQRERIVRFLGRYNDSVLPEIKILEYEEHYGISEELAKKVVENAFERLLLINSNLIFEKELVHLFKETPMPQGGSIRCKAGAHSIPMYEVSSNAIERLHKEVAVRPRSIETAIRIMLEGGDVAIVNKPAEINTFLVTHCRERAVAEKSLAEAIRLRIDGPVARYINKRISLPVSLILSKLWISPNTITAFNIIVGVFSGVFVADGNRYHYILAGAILFQLASIIDGCDGEVAKLTFRATKFGQYADTLCDNLSLGSFITGLIAGYWRQTHSYVAFYIGSILVFTTGVTFFWMIRFLKKNTDSASLVTYDKQYLSKLKEQPKFLMIFIKYGKYLLKKDVFSFMFLCSAIFGVLYWWLFLATLGTSSAAIVLTYLNIAESLKKRTPTVIASEGKNL